ncbi:MAG TPA: chromate efflux transporter [Solirubrobacteraceae bacterium]|nr:chromate efflux transporter [Solirubrobacteraceae bacterium]
MPSQPASPVSPRTLVGLFCYFLKLGTSGFGGPIALVGYMQRDLVEQRGWFTETEYHQGLALAQTMPGPLAAQLAMWFGYLQAGVLGAAAVAIPFVGPPCLLVTAVAVLYAKYQGLSVVHEVFLGVGPAVLAIIAIAAYKLARTTNKTDPLLWVIAGVVCAVTAVAKTEIVWLFLAAGAFGIVYYGGGLPRPQPPSAASFTPTGLLAAVKGFSWTGSSSLLGSMSLFFAKASAFTFGSGLAIVPFLHQGLVHDHHWLTEQQFVDAVAMGLISPGPVVIMATFAGYIVGGIVGALLATAAVFLPVYLFVIVPGPLLLRHGEHPRLLGFIKGATAAAAGAIAGAAIVIGQQVIATGASVAIALVALALLLQRRLKLPEPALVGTAALIGIIALR